MVNPGKSYFKLRLTPSSVRAQSQTHQRSQGSLAPSPAHIPGRPQKFINETNLQFLPPRQGQQSQKPAWTLISPAYSQHVRYFKYFIGANFSDEKRHANKPFSENLFLRKYSWRQSGLCHLHPPALQPSLWLHTAQPWPASSFMQLALQCAIKGAKLKKPRHDCLGLYLPVNF